MRHKFSLRTQLVGIILLTSTLAMLAAGATLFITEISRSRDALSEELTSLARLIGDRSSAALLFLDTKTARENLNAVSGLEQIGSACLFNEQGALFVKFARAEEQAKSCVAQLPIQQQFAQFKDGTVHVQMPVLVDANVIGAIQINSTAAPLVHRLAAQTLSLAVALGGALALAILLTLRLQRVISRPLAQVRDVANAIVASGNYALRAPDLGQHELGQLATAFNRMLLTIETQNGALAENEAYARRLFYDSPIPQLVADPVTLTYSDCNQAAVLIHGYANRGELIGKTTLDVSAPTQYDGRESQQALRESGVILREAGVFQTEWRYRRADGELWDGLLNAMHITLNDRESLHISVQDITQRKLAEDRLQQLNQELEQRVTRRTGELASTNTTLMDTLSELRRAQDELVQREKMASLGVLTAGVAHELNTPLGNGLTVCTSMQAELASLDANIAASKLTRGHLNVFVEQVRTGLKLLLRNLERALDQVAHFKQVAVDQTSDQRRQFELDKVIGDIIEILQPQFKRTPHRIIVDLPPGCMMDSYPGALGQVATNLVLNSLIHGFSDDMSGEIRVTAELGASGQVRMVFADNGKGIPAENLARVFDPFYTTRMGQGGSGLGLSIVFNIVKSTLGGSIRVESQQGVRTAFCIDIPCNAPEVAVSAERIA